MHRIYIGIVALVLLSSPFVGSVWFDSRTEGIDFNLLKPNFSVEIDGIPFVVAVAETQEDRRQGLSNVETLPEDHGLLFVFTSSDTYGIWMKDMNFPIDIIWFDNEFRVVDLTEDLSPLTYPETIHPRKPVRYILEVDAGFIERNTIKIGSFGKFKRE